MTLKHQIGDNKNLKSYRPINILSNVYKLYTNVLANCMQCSNSQYDKLVFEVVSEEWTTSKTLPSSEKYEPIARNRGE